MRSLELFLFEVQEPKTTAISAAAHNIFIDYSYFLSSLQTLEKNRIN
jgi:hypothetical protein